MRERNLRSRGRESRARVPDGDARERHGRHRGGNYYGSALITDQPPSMTGTFYKKHGRLVVGYSRDRLKLA